MTTRVMVAGGLLALSVGPTASVSLGADLLVASRGSDQVLRYDGGGASRGVFASDPTLVRPVGITFGPDGDLYVAAGDTDHVSRFDGKTGRAKGVFTHGASIQSPRNVNFGPDGDFYVADGFLNQILRFDGKTGAFDRVFIRDPALNGPTSFTFGPDGDVYVASVLTNSVLRFDGETGALRGPFATQALVQPHDVSFGPDGNLYVTNSGSGLVQRFRGDTGEHLGPFVNDGTLRQPLGMAWGLDGDLYVANQGANEVRRYDGSTGASRGSLVSPAAGGLSSPSFLAFLPPSKLTLAVKPDAAREAVLVKVSGARPGARVLLVHGSPGGSSSLRDCPRLRLGIGGAKLGEARVADESGTSVALFTGTRGARVSLVAVDAGRCAASKPVAVTLP